MKTILLIFIILLLPLFACADVEIMDAWVREAPPEAKMHAGYFSLKNVGTEDVELLSVGSKDYESVMLHQTRVEGELTSMRHLSSVIIPAGQTVQFTPGGMHLMLMAPVRKLKTGDEVELEFVFKKINNAKINAIVKR